MTMSLEGLRVIDLSTHLSGPYCSMLLGDMGADVVKVERPEGDDMRHVPPFVHGESAPVMLFNRNKRSAVLDLKSAQSREACARLAGSADVFLENFRPGVAAALLDEERAGVRARRIARVPPDGALAHGLPDRLHRLADLLALDPRASCGSGPPSGSHARPARGRAR